MTTAEAASPRAESAFLKELKMSAELLARLRDALLNRIFDLRPERAKRRRRYLIFLLLLSFFLISLTHENYSLSHWGQNLRMVFLFLFSRSFAATPTQENPIIAFLRFVWQAFTDPYTLQYLPILLAPFFIALQSAAIYLADVFELEELGVDVGVARKFIWAVALSGSNETIRISQGDISEESRKSPTFVIGGPGKVTVDLDSAALFEKPDGTPRVIGPTTKEPGGKATLEGFERFRQAIDLRDQFIELRDQNEKASSVKSRSIDGIPVTATDVRLMFSVYRDGNKATPQTPYPFSQKSIEQLIYRATSKVTPDLPTASSHEFSWFNGMTSLVRSELGRFMSEHKLTEYLASTGTPEFKKAKEQEAAIATHARRLTVPAEEAPAVREVGPVPKFTPRPEITSLFSQFAQKFTENARERGVELHWIGVGTWKTSDEIVLEKHLEAWKLSQENMRREAKDTLEGLEKEAIMQKMAALIQDVPVALAASLKTRMEDKEHEKAMKTVLLAYRQQLLEAAEFMRTKGEAVPVNIRRAIEHLSQVLGFSDWHWVGPDKP